MLDPLEVGEMASRGAIGNTFHQRAICNSDHA